MSWFKIKSNRQHLRQSYQYRNEKTQTYAINNTKGEVTVESIEIHEIISNYFEKLL